MADNLLMRASTSAQADGALTADEHEQLMAFAGRVSAFDWQGLLTNLAPLLAFIPGIGPLLPIIAKLIPYIIEILNKLPNGGGTGPDPN